MVKIIIIFTLKVRIDKNKSISGHTFLCRVSVFTEYGIETGFSLSQNKHVLYTVQYRSLVHIYFWFKHFNFTGIVEVTQSIKFFVKI